MSDTIISQNEADALFQMEKISTAANELKFPSLGGNLELSFTSENNKEEFFINYRQSSINLVKRNHHMRGRNILGLARLDLFGPPHRNPNGEEIGPCHLHLYKEGYDLKWAQEVPENLFGNLKDSYETLRLFMVFCNVKKLPHLTKDLFHE